MNTILAIASRYTPLHQRGEEWWGCCPFHTEKTPSFSVNPAKGVFHCFGCEKSGDAITLLRELDGKTFAEAAALVGKDLPERRRTPALSRRVRQLTHDFTQWREACWVRAYQVLFQARRRLIAAQDVQRFYQLAPCTFTPDEIRQAVEEHADASHAVQAAQRVFLLFGPDGETTEAQRLWQAAQEKDHV